MRHEDPRSRPQSIDAVKTQLIARRNEFVEQQKLDRFRNTVVKGSEVTDPLVNDPPRLTNVAYDGRGLSFDLSRGVSSDWIATFQNMPVGGLMGYGPEYHTFSGARGYVSVPERLAQQVIDQFKFYLQTANDNYARQVKEKNRQDQESAKYRLAAEIAEQERRAKIQSQLRW